MDARADGASTTASQRSLTRGASASPEHPWQWRCDEQGGQGRSRAARYCVRAARPARSRAADSRHRRGLRRAPRRQSAQNSATRGPKTTATKIRDAAHERRAGLRVQGAGAFWRRLRSAGTRAHGQRTNNSRISPCARSNGQRPQAKLTGIVPELLDLEPVRGGNRARGAEPGRSRPSSSLRSTSSLTGSR